MNPNPNVKYPIEGNKNVHFIKNTITKANIRAGDYSYYDAKDGETFEDRVLHHYEFLGDHLIIGKLLYCKWSYLYYERSESSDGWIFGISI